MLVSTDGSSSLEQGVQNSVPGTLVEKHLTLRAVVRFGCEVWGTVRGGMFRWPERTGNGLPQNCGTSSCFLGYADDQRLLCL